MIPSAAKTLNESTKNSRGVRGLGDKLRTNGFGIRRWKKQRFLEYLTTSRMGGRKEPKGGEIYTNELSNKGYKEKRGGRKGRGNRD